MRHEAIDGILQDIEELTDEDKQRLIEGYNQPDANGQYTPFCAAIVYILKEYFL